MSTPPGDLVYHLVVLFAIEAIVWMTWRHRHAGRARRWARAAWALSAGRIGLILVAGLAAYKIVPSSTAILPPLERFVEVVSLGFLLWGFVPLLEVHPRAARWFAVGNLCLAAIFYVYAATQWFITAPQGHAFNATMPDTVWTVWALALSLAGVITALPRRQDEWALSVTGFALMALGHGLHLFFPDPKLDSAEWFRLTALAAYPLFAALVYRHIEALRWSPTFELPQRTADLWPVAQACRAVSDSNDQSRALSQAASAIGQAIRADLVVVGLPGDSPDTVGIAAVFQSGDSTGPGTSASLDAHPLVRQAIALKSPVTCDLGNDAAALAEWLSATPRPFLIEPLVHAGETIGVLIASETERSLPASPSEAFARAAHAAAAQLASALGAARKTEVIARRTHQLAVALRDEETRAAQSNAVLEVQLARAQADLLATQTQLKDVQGQAVQHQKRAAEIAALVELQMSAPANWQTQARQLNEERAQAVIEAQALKQQVEKLLQRQSELETTLAQAQEQHLEPGRKNGAPPLPAGEVESQASVGSGSQVNGAETEPAQREVIASLAQELRTPMTSITGYTDLLLTESAGILGAMQRQFLQRVKANIERMNGMLADLVRVTVVDTQNMPLEPEPIDLIKIIEEAIMGSAAQFRERNISIQLDLAERLPPVHADRDSLYQVMSHLLANAGLCSRPGTEVMVSAQQTRDDEHVSVSVTDTGGGIHPSDQVRVFARRYRADNPLIEGLGDTGIGLSIAKTLVEAQGGRIWVNSEAGKGSTFTFILRIVQASDVSQ